MDDDLKADAREHLEISHRLNREVLEAVLRVADETGRDPGELAQLLQMGGGMNGALQPLIMRWHEAQQRRWAAQQRPPG